MNIFEWLWLSKILNIFQLLEGRLAELYEFHFFIKKYLTKNISSIKRQWGSIELIKKRERFAKMKLHIVAVVGFSKPSRNSEKINEKLTNFHAKLLENSSKVGLSLNFIWSPARLWKAYYFSNISIILNWDLKL